MARRWLSVRVELLGGRGEELWPPPGRVLVVGPSHTFQDLAHAINDAFGRWDRAHLSMFTMADGRVVTDEQTAVEFASSPVGPLEQAPLLLTVAKVARTAARGESFRYVFDLGDEWTHACTVEEPTVDPETALGVVPAKPLPSWGWGAIPDQYGRRWDGDDGQSRVPPRPARSHPMLFGGWPERTGEPVDPRELRGAVARRDVPAILQALEGRDVDHFLQQVGTGLQVALDDGGRSDRARVESLAVSVVNRLTLRQAPGDETLAQDLLARLRHEPAAGRELGVDLEMVAMQLEGDPHEPGGYLDLRTGEVLDATQTDPAMVGEEYAVDLDEEPDRWLPLERLGSREGYRDMTDFVSGVTSTELHGRLQLALDGKGAFRRFRDVIHEDGLADRWHAFAEDRQAGRAREFLAAHGIRASAPRLDAPPA